MLLLLHNCDFYFWKVPIKEHKHDKDATNCMYCNGKTMSVTDDNGKCVCELCGRFKPKKADI